MPAKKIKLMPTLREKRHYVVLIGEGAEQELKKIIEKAILDFIGTLGYAKAGPLFIEGGKNKGNVYFIVSVVTGYVDAVKSAMALIKKPRVKCIGVSGTIKKAKRFLK
jgi:RNase P/RNase MRP subunit POP5